MEEKQIYISFERPEYKQNKAELLQCHLALINLQKRVSHLKAIRANKKRHLAQLSKSFASLGVIIERLDLKLPESVLPNELKKKMALTKHKEGKKEFVEKPRKEKVVKEKEASEEAISDLDNELLRIREKLNSLGAL